MAKKTVSKGNWDIFWKRNTDSQFTRISWSKRRICNILDEFIGDGSCVLDAGCGSGFFSEYFVKKGCNAYSLDYSIEALDATKKRTNNKCVDYINTDLLDKDFQQPYDKKFDLIFTDGLLEHFDEPDQMMILHNLISMKKDGGVIVTFVPNKYSPWELIRPLFMPGIHEDPFSFDGLTRLHHKSGLTCVARGGINVLPFKLSPDRILGKKFGMLLYFIGK